MPANNKSLNKGTSHDSNGKNNSADVRIWEFRHKGGTQYYRASTYAEARKQYKDWNNLD